MSVSQPNESEPLQESKRPGSWIYMDFTKGKSSVTGFLDFTRRSGEPEKQEPPAQNP